MKLINDFKKKKNKEIFYVALFVIVPLIILIALSILMKFQKNKIAVEQTPKEVVPVQTTPKINVDIAAKSAYVKRVDTNEVIFAKNETESLPLASITKAMTALFAYENIEPKSLIRITQYDLNQDGEYGLYLGETFLKEKLIDFAMVVSSNDAASALISHISLSKSVERSSIISQMNEYGKKIGMRNTVFRNETGLDISEFKASSTGTAEDISKLFEYITKNYPEVLDSTRERNISVRSESGEIHNIKNTNAIVGRLTGLLGSKTGYTDLAGGNLAVVVDVGLNDPYIIVVLGSTQEKRFEDVEKIYKEIIKL